jgi:aminomethyltransferase
MEQLKNQSLKTALYDRHCALGAKMVDFSGWKMPVQYQGIIAEHHAVRNNVGIFDVSHMGRIIVQGEEAEKFLDYISTNIISGKSDYSATYTVWSNASGGCIDDVIVYKINPTNFFVIANAGNRQKDVEHLQKESKRFKVTIKDCFATEGILAIQGPKAISLMSKVFPEAKDLPAMHFCEVIFEGKKMILSHTGYTGAGGVEIYAPTPLIILLWDRIIDEGAVPIGLGARDTLRLEMGYALYGHEISEDIAANESVSCWTVKWKKNDFLGKATLESIENSLDKRTEYGVILQEPGIARAGYEVFLNGEKIGHVTSGSHSPTLNHSIAIILSSVKLQEGDEVEIQIRQNFCKAKVVKLPFVEGRT